FVISNSEHSTVTYTSISSDYEEPSDVGSPRVMVYGYNGLPMHPPSPDYVPGPEHPPSPVYVPYLPKTAYLEFMPPKDKEDLEEEDDEDPEEDPPDYPTNIDDDEEEEHLALADSVPSPQTCTRGARMTSCYDLVESRVSSTSHLLPLPPPIVLPCTRASMVMIRAAAPSTYILAPRSGILPSGIPPSGTPPLLPIPLPTSSPPLLLPSTDCRVDVPEVTLPPQKRLCIALDPKYMIGECSSDPTARPTRGFRADYCFVGTLDAKIRRDLDREIGYGITDIWVDLDEIAEEIPATDVAELGQRMTDFITTVRQDREA
ncbi:hypothetical protein Tco_1334219, partial [Tanacetum coccineum]